MRDPRERLRDIGIDTDIVWDTVTQDIPALKPAVEQLLQRLEEGTDYLSDEENG